jgi:putative zinc finger/helix-turn-helix YgiT family protein
MKCPVCNKGTLTSRREDYKYSESGLPDVVLVHIEVRRCRNPSCREVMPVIPAVTVLHREMAFALARQRTKLRGAETRFLRKYLGWSGADAAKRLGVTPETMSRWEHDQTPMGASAERLLRVLTLTKPPIEHYPADALLSEVGQDEGPRPTMRLRGDGARWMTAA